MRAMETWKIQRPPNGMAEFEGLNEAKHWACKSASWVYFLVVEQRKEKDRRSGPFSILTL
jgi:hypothetical protein